VATGRCFVVLFASSILLFVRRTNLDSNHPTDAQVIETTGGSYDALGTLRKNRIISGFYTSRFQAKEQDVSRSSAG
jgi:hypothetical protein